MGVKKHVFGSASERDNFYKLSRHWGDKYHIHHNLPFLNVFDTSNLVDNSQSSPQRVVVNDLDFARLKKTSIDFTLCDDNDEPQLCIEFDGLQQGVNVGPKYYAGGDPQSRSPWRQQITELKLRVAFLSGFPFFVVGSTQFARLSRTTELTIVDSIIGQVMAYKTFSRRFQTGDMLGDLGISSDEFDRLSRGEQQDLVDHWGTGVEVGSIMDSNPIARRTAELEMRLIGTSLFEGGHLTGAAGPPPDPTQPDAAPPLVGTKYTIRLKRFGPVTRTVLLPDFRVPHFYTSNCTWEIAEMLAAEAAVELLEHAGVLKPEPVGDGQR